MAQSIVPRGRAARAAVAALLVAALVLVAGFGVQRLLAPVPAPALSLRAIDGERIELARLRGRVVLIEFWATNCSVCLREMPDMAALARELAPAGLTMIAIAMPYDRPDHVLAYARRHQLPFTVALDPMGAALEAFGPIPGTPTRFIVARDGTLVARLVGAADPRMLRARLRDELARAAPGGSGSAFSGWLRAWPGRGL